MRQVLAPCAVGGLRDEVAPGDLVVPDQLVDRTPGRVQSYVETGRGARAVRRPLLPDAVRGRRRAPTGVTHGGTMVVVEGPRFSTRAESQHYAAQGWTLINMTGHPEAVLARELRMCYSAVALVTDMDAGVESGEGVGQAEVFAMFARNIDRLKDLLAGVVGDLPEPGAGCACASWADGIDLPYESRVPREGPADRLRRASSAARSPSQLEAQGDEVVRVDLLIPEAHAPGATAPDTHLVDVRDASARPAAARRRRRGLPPVRDGRRRGHGRRPAVVRLAQRPRHRRPARRHARRRRAPDRGRVVDGGLRRGSLRVRGARRPGAAAAQRRRRSTPATSRTTARVCGRPLDVGARRRGRPARPAQQLRREQGRHRALPDRVGAAGARRGGRAEVPQRLRPADAARHALLRGRRAVPLRASSRAGRRTSSRTAARCATSCTSHDVARANLLSLRQVVEAPDESFTTYNVASGEPVPIRRVAELVAGGTGRDLAPEVSGRYRLGDVRHVVASPEKARVALGFTARDPAREGLRQFATAPLR